ncbi:MAG: hypothetical protein JW765_07385 [Deltaproteobacteria bacterium]|nr:hypothetical protein [Candidatus Zymogenaceae bacterium]
MRVGLTGRHLITFRSSLLFLGLVLLFHPAMVTVILKDETLLASFGTLAAPVETLPATRKAVTTLPSEIRGDAPPQHRSKPTADKTVVIHAPF